MLWWARTVGIPAAVAGDIAAPALAIGLAIGRIGCQLAGDGDYGVPTDLPWGMSYPDGAVPTTERVHPTPIYEMVMYTAIFAFLWRQRRRGLPDGHLLAQYLVYSGRGALRGRVPAPQPGVVARVDDGAVVLAREYGLSVCISSGARQKMFTAETRRRGDIVLETQ